VTIALLAALVVVGAVALMMRAGSLARSRSAQNAAVVTTAEPPKPDSKESSTGAPKAGSHAAVPSRPPRVNEHGQVGSSSRSRGPYTLDVGGYSDYGTALDQRDRMQQLTGFEGWVVDAADGGSKPYRIVLGAYRSEERATGAANMLMRSRTLHDVTVVPLPPRNTRR